MHNLTHMSHGCFWGLVRLNRLSSFAWQHENLMFSLKKTGSVLLLVSLGGSRIKFGVPWGEAFKTSTNNTFQKFYLIMWILQTCKEHWFRDCCFPFCRFTSQITAPLGSGVKPVPKKMFHLQTLPGRYIKTAWNTDTCTM